MSSCRDSAEPARRRLSSASAAEQRAASVSLESYTRTVSCIRESTFDLATRRDLVTVMLVNGFSAGTSSTKASITQYIQSLPLFQPCFSSLHPAGNGAGSNDTSTDPQMHITPMAMKHTELNDDLMALKTWFNMDSTDGLLKPFGSKLGHERFGDTSLDSNRKSCNNAVDSQMKRYTVPMEDYLGGSTLHGEPGKKDSIPLQRSTDPQTLGTALANISNSDEDQAIRQSGVHREDHVFTASDLLLENTSVQGKLPNHDHLLHLSRPWIKNPPTSPSFKNLPSTLTNGTVPSTTTKGKTLAIGPLLPSRRNISSTSTNGNISSASDNGNVRSTTSTVGNPSSMRNADLIFSFGDMTRPSVRDITLTSSSVRADNSASSLVRNDSLTSSIRNNALISSSVGNDPPLSSIIGNDPQTTATMSAANKALDEDVINSALSGAEYNHVHNLSGMPKASNINEKTKTLSFLQDSSAPSALRNVQSVLWTSCNGGASTGFLQMMNDISSAASSSYSNDLETFDLLSRWENRRKKQAIDGKLNSNEKTPASIFLCPLSKDMKRKRKQRSISQFKVITTTEGSENGTINNNSCDLINNQINHVGSSELRRINDNDEMELAMVERCGVRF